MAARDLASWLSAQETKDLLRFVAIGSVDDGKSTLIGRLLHDAHGLYQDQLDAARRASARGATRGGGSTSEIDFSLFTDGLQAEREQGITIDVAYRYFATERRKFIIADTPGHVQYTRNMATGASTADAALILVDARLGVLPQTRRHAHIAALLGIGHVVACVNKMDLVGYDRDRFEAIRDELRDVGRRLGIDSIRALPVSALAGDNVVARSDRTPWWDGPPLLELLETLPVADGRRAAPFRMPVQLVLRPDLDYRGFAGTIASGAVRAGDEVVLLPSRRRTRVTAVELGGEAVSEAAAPLSVTLRLADAIDVSRGDMIACPEHAPRATTELEADLVWMSEQPLDRARAYLLKHTTRTVRAEVVSIVHGTDAETLAPTPSSTLGLNDIARVRVQCRLPIFVDPYAKDRATGAFILIDSLTNDTVAAGMIADVVAAGGEAVEPPPSTRPLQDDERRRFIGQGGAVLHVQAPSWDAAQASAYALERELVRRGHFATVVDGRAPNARAIAEGCARACLVALVPQLGATHAFHLGDDAAQACTAQELTPQALETLIRRGVFDP